MANLNTKTIASGVGDILACDGGIPTGSTATQVKSGDGDVSPLYLTDGEIGIGTANPTAQLHLVGSGTDGQLIIENTNAEDPNLSAPDLRLYRNSASVANEDSIGKIEFFGNDAGGNATQYAYIHCRSVDVTAGDEKGNLEFLVLTDGGGPTFKEALTLGGNGNVGIHTGDLSGQPEFPLTVHGDAYFHQAGQAYDGDPKAIGLLIRTAKTGTGTPPVGTAYADCPILDFRRWTGGEGITTHQSALIAGSPENSGGLVFYVNEEANNNPATTERMRITKDGKVGIGDSVPDSPLHVTGSASSGVSVLKLEQLDDNEPFVRFQGTTASDQTKSLSTDTTVGALTGHIRVSINGTDYWVPYYATN